MFSYDIVKLMCQAQKEEWSEEQIDAEIGAIMKQKVAEKVTHFPDNLLFNDGENTLVPKIKIPENIKKIWDVDGRFYDDGRRPIGVLKGFPAKYIECIRKFVFVWDPYDMGAPMVSVDRPYGSVRMFDDLAVIFDSHDQEVLAQHHLEISSFLIEFIQQAELSEGMYDVKNTTFKAMSKELPKRTYAWANEPMFHFKEEHRLLLNHFCFHWLKGESIEERLTYGYPTIGVDPKRPYGAFSYYQVAMAKILNYDLSKNEEGDHQLSEKLYEELTDLHFELLPAIQVFVEHATM